MDFPAADDHGIAAYGFFLRPQMLKWGTRLGESQRRLPGDELVPQPNARFTHAMSIDAPPEALWPGSPRWDANAQAPMAWTL